MPWQRSHFSVGAAVNDRAMLARCLARSPDIASGDLSLATYENYDSAAKALNAALDGSPTPIVILAHQDIYLPQGFLDRLIAHINQLESEGRAWGVLGPFGLMSDRTVAGRVYSMAIGCELGERSSVPQPVVCLDEIVLVLNREGPLRFDEATPGFHLYGVDIVLQARDLGLGAYAIDAPVVHVDAPVSVKALRGAYRRAYDYMKRKWAAELPVPTLIADLSRSPLPYLRTLWRRFKTTVRTGVKRPGLDPVEVARAMGYE
jgi:hypothetical protein